ncbi:hypothetical protein LWC35_10000 [Pseudonocardia kujensis]|uniref:hypothetical protein n=1 Tax=Pseudonocardia kujensis TaxID=1128675 RepID=UPI001E4392B2|nr:hypothetical protein [Pseudonocardia kujensis]MCE0763236.1 hypothetical protein [Pseudonocardia kujensis]
MKNLVDLAGGARHRRAGGATGPRSAIAQLAALLESGVQTLEHLGVERGRLISPKTAQRNRWAEVVPPAGFEPATPALGAFTYPFTVASTSAFLAFLEQRKPR